MHSVTFLPVDSLKQLMLSLLSINEFIQQCEKYVVANLREITLYTCREDFWLLNSVTFLPVDSPEAVDATS